MAFWRHSPENRNTSEANNSDPRVVIETYTVLYVTLFVTAYYPMVRGESLVLNFALK